MLITGRCPKCQNQLQIPSELEQFCCMYCGAKLSRFDMAPKVSSSEGEEAKAYYETHILDVIKNHVGIDKEVTGALYADAFSRYREQNAEIFHRLDQAVAADLYSLEDAAAEFLDQLEAYWQTDTERKQRISFKKETDKFVIAVFLVPMVRAMKLSISEEYCQQLQAQWCKRNPKSPFFLGTYEELSKNFKTKPLGFCFITTAICEFEGKADDCEELTAFRAFRDEFLRSCPDGERLVQEYYDIAPALVMHMELSPHRDQIYRHLRDTYLRPCYEDLQHGRLHSCKDRYANMVRTLERKYLS